MKCVKVPGTVVLVVRNQVLGLGWKEHSLMEDPDT